MLPSWLTVGNMRAAIYVRYSSENQREASLEDQERLCRERAKAEGWSVGAVYRDRALSGSSTLRPGYQALLTAARTGAFGVVVAEALDRLSRDQEDVAGLYKRLSFEGIRIVTLAEGEISELHVGLKGTMNALFLRDLAAKTHRGLRGRVEAGLSGGGNAYGYQVVRRLGADGNAVTGERQIDVDQARVVARIFESYAAGVSPKKIVLALNQEGIAGPRGGQWSPSTINGNRRRGTGILNNELYVGRMTWNRLRYVKDPETGLRQSRARPDSELIVAEVPELRIVDQALWDAAKSRQAALDHAAADGEQSSGANDQPAPFWSKQRPRYLFSGLMRCGVCGSGFSKVSAAHFGCSTARNKGATACTNLLTLRRDRLEATVLDGLANRLMDPDLFKVFVAEFTAEWNKLQASVSADRGALESELVRVCAQIERLVDALANGTPAAAVNSRLAAMEKRRLELEASLAQSEAPAPRLHPNLAEVYRQRVASLSEALMAEDGAEAREQLRSLIDHILVVPEAGVLRVEIRGELASILALASAGRSKGASVSLSEAEALSVQIKLVAGACFGRQLTLPSVAC